MKNAVSIKLIQCAKTFANGAQALQPIELEIHPGETVVLLGQPPKKFTTPPLRTSRTAASQTSGLPTASMTASNGAWVRA